MEVHVLGPLEVVSDDGDVARPQGHTAHLLAALIHSAGRAVSTEALIGVLWGERPPSTARASIQVYVAKIRKVIAAASADAIQPIETVPDGYRFDHTDVTVDTARFRVLVEQARHLPESLRQAQLTEALALWRGRPYGPWSDETFFVGDTTSLEELREAVEEDLVDVELGLGRHDALVAELRTLVEAAPLRERRWRQLMLALYRSDRRAESLRTYQRLRTVLGTELGIEPGPEAVALEEAILFDDQALLLSDQPRQPEIPFTPLPDPGTSFIGRDREIAEIDDLLERHPLVTLTGPGGVGKTRIATEIARATSGDAVAVPIFIDLSDITEADLVISAVALATGRQPTNAEGGAVANSDVIAAGTGASTVLVLDNCEHVLDAVGRVVEDIRSYSPQMHVLAASLEPLGLAFEAVYQLDPLPVPELDTPPSEMAGTDAVRLFADRAKQRSHEFALTDSNISAVAQICRLLDGLPLAIELAATALGTLSPEELAAELEHSLAPLSDVRRGSNSRHKTLAATVDWSYRRLDEPSQRLLRRLSVFRNGWTLPDTGPVTDLEGQGPDEIRTGLSKLVNRSLVDFNASAPSPRYRLLEPIRRIAWDLCAETEELETMRSRHAKHFRDIARQATTDTNGRDRAKWYVHFEAERENYRAAIDWAMEECKCGYLATLLPAVSRYWFRRDLKGDEQRLTQRVLEHCTCLTTGRAPPIVMYGAQAALANGDSALASERLDQFSQMQPLGINAESQLYWHVRGNLIGFGFGNPAASLPLFDKAVTIGESIASPRTLMSLALLGYMKARMLDPSGVEDALGRMGEWKEESPSWYDIALDELPGMVAFYEGDLDTATVLLRSSHDKLRSAGRLASLPPSVVHLGWALLESDRETEATLLARTTLKSISADGGWQRAGIVSLVGRCALRSGDHDAAVDHFYDCIEMSRRGPALDTTAWGLTGLGFALNESGHTKMSATALIAAWTVMEEHQILLPSTEHERYLDLLETMTEELGSDHVTSIEEQILAAGIDETVAMIRSSVM